MGSFTPRILLFILLGLTVCRVPAQTSLPGTGSAGVADSASRAQGADSLATRGPVSRADTTLIIKHHFNHKQQIITGSIIMACMATMVVVMNNYNPQGLNP